MRYGILGERLKARGERSFSAHKLFSVLILDSLLLTLILRNA